MRLLLKRLFEVDETTVGNLSSQDGALNIFTIERPWLDNAPSVSCVPPGFYVLEPHSSERFPDTWALVGDTVSHYEGNEARSAILFHAANYSHELQGCIAPCTEVDIRTDFVCGNESKEAMDDLRSVIGDGPAYLTIEAVERVRGKQ